MNSADFPDEDGMPDTFRMQGEDRVGNAGAWLETAAVTTNAVTKPVDTVLKVKR